MRRSIYTVALLSTLFFISTSSGEGESKDSNFSIKGDFSNTPAIDFDEATITVTATGLSEDGSPMSVELATAELVGAKFALEGFVDEATIANITLKLPDEQYPTTGRAIIEPGSELTIEFFGPHHSLLAEGEGLHAELISSWASDPEYLDASISYGFYMESLYARMDKQQEAAEAAAEEETADVEGQDEEAAAVAEEVDEEREPSEHAEVRDWASLECADYAVENYVSVIEREYDDSEYPLLTQTLRRLSDVMSEKRNAVLEKVVQESDDPTKRLFAMELGAFGGMNQQSLALNIWRQLAIVLDDQIVAARVQPTIDRMERSVAIKTNDDNLNPGVFAPTFTLPNFEGTDIALTSILEENEVVMIDFWASWCGPCIAQFPHLKELYAEYAEKGFEIVGISLDSTHEDWAGAIEKHQPPWLQLGEINEDGWGPISQEYGVRFIPHTYVLDEESCIMKKDLQPVELEDFLKARFDS
ncbi:MAG: TlpA family protein disulfide reductase [Gammaproteobacteria bacterium]|nr:TlpA family protein disulfide reductase [Gammaproteobacteria bacterium]